MSTTLSPRQPQTARMGVSAAGSPLSASSSPLNGDSSPLSRGVSFWLFKLAGNVGTKNIECSRIASTGFEQFLVMKIAQHIAGSQHNIIGSDPTVRLESVPGCTDVVGRGLGLARIPAANVLNRPVDICSSMLTPLSHPMDGGEQLHAVRCLKALDECCHAFQTLLGGWLGCEPVF